MVFNDFVKKPDFLQWNPATFDNSIYPPYADAMKGGETETKIAYLVKGHPEYATFSV